MGSSFYPPLRLTAAVIVLSAFLLPSLTLSGPVSFPSISPNFTASYAQYIDNSGAFLASLNGSFQARITNAKPELTSYYLVVVHVASNTIVWTANRNNPVSQSSQLSFSDRGLVLYNETGHPIWSTPLNLSSVSSLLLLDSGNLVLLDSSNNSVWESFDFPTDVLVVGQRLQVGSSLVSSVSDEDLSEGSYQLVVGNSDALFQWNRMVYWRLSMDTNAISLRNIPVEYMAMDFTGVYLMGASGLQIVTQVILHNRSDVQAANSSNFRILKLDRNGLLSVVKFNEGDGSSQQEFQVPKDSCRIPFVCKTLGICSNGGYCQCAPGFQLDSRMNDGNCVPTDTSLSLPGPSCGTSVIKYLDLRSDLDYFSNNFMDPSMRDVNISVCENYCSTNCSCLGFFYSRNSRSCYLVRNFFGSVFAKSGSAPTDASRLGYVKVIVTNGGGGSDPSKGGFPLVEVVLLPCSGVLVIVLIGVVYWMRRRKKREGRSGKSKIKKVEEDIDFVSIPGLPVRFDYVELESATDHFKTQIGSGGFGTVFKGTLRDGTDVAVKKMTCLGSQGKRELLTEIAVIGKIHHVNLVRLKGFCSHQEHSILVYEYMNRGSLDRNLFGCDSVMEWKERYEIALGTARGLAYLHSGCEHKIIHCDVKPENILLHDKSQVKISDFGLSKLLSPEQSGLFTTLRGTRGYLAPEWLTSSAISDKTDVYSYGMVLLEIISGKKNSSPQLQNYSSSTNSNRGNGTVGSSSSSDDQQRLVYFPLFALEMHEAGRYLELVDPRLNRRVRSEEVEKLVRVALCCVQEEPSLRPSMTNVVGMLEGGMPLGNPRIESLNFLRFYGRRFTEASRLGGDNDEPNDEERLLCRQQTKTTTSSFNSFSYLSSQQVSGPR